MAFEKLHKNSGKNIREWVIGRIFIFLNKSEDGLWSRQNEEGTRRTTHLFAVNIIEKNEGGEHTRALNVVIWKYNFSCALLAN